MTVPLSPAERRKLVSILGMLGSEHDGERAAAAGLASRLVHDKGLTWDTVIRAGEAERKSTASSNTADDGCWRTMLALCQQYQAVLSEWEAHFIKDLHGRRTPPTPRQMAKVGQIADSLRARGLA